MIKTIIKYLLILFLSFILFCPLISEAANAGSLLDGKLNAGSKKERVDIAKDLLAKIDSLNSYLPTMKPSEAAWIKEEETAIDKLDLEAYLERMNKLDNSPEYQHQQLKLLFNRLHDDLQCIINKNSTLKDEMLCWVTVSINLPSRRFYAPLVILKKHGRLLEDFGEKSGLYIRDNLIIIFDHYSTGIQRYIIYPYISGAIR